MPVGTQTVMLANGTKSCKCSASQLKSFFSDSFTRCRVAVLSCFYSSGENHARWEISEGPLQFGVLSRRRFSFHFFPHSTRAFCKPALFQRCSLSRVFDERVRNRALDRSAPLNAPKPSRVSRRKKLFLKEKMK